MEKHRNLNIEEEIPFKIKEISTLKKELDIETYLFDIFRTKIILDK